MNKIIGCGSITDGSYKLEIHIMNFSYDEYLELEIKKGDKVKITGIMQAGGKNIYIYYYNSKTLILKYYIFYLSFLINIK